MRNRWNCNSVSSGALDDTFIVSIALTSGIPPCAYNYVTYYGGAPKDNALAIAGDAVETLSSREPQLQQTCLSSTTTYQGRSGNPKRLHLETEQYGRAVTYDTYFGGDGTDSGLGIDWTT